MKKTLTRNFTARLSVIIIVALLAASLYADTAEDQTIQILILPFTSLGTTESSVSLAADLYRAFWDAFDCEQQLESIGDLDNPITGTTFTDDDLLTQGKNANVNWVIAGELQGEPVGWELFFRIMDPQEAIPRYSSAKGYNPHDLIDIAEKWVKDNLEFLTITDLQARAQKEEELSVQEAVDLYKQARKLKGKDQETIERKIAMLEKAVEIHPGFTSAYQSLGYVYQQQGRYQEALDAYQLAVETKPTYHIAYYNIGTVYQKMRNYDAAADAYRTATKLNPKYREAWFNLASVLKFNHEGMEYGDGFDARGVEDALLKALEADTTFLGSYVSLGIFYQKTQQYQASKEAYEEALRRNENYQLAWYNLALLYDSFLQDFPMAIHAYERYIDLGGQRAPGARNRIAALEKKLTMQDSIKRAEKNQIQP